MVSRALPVSLIFIWTLWLDDPSGPRSPAPALHSSPPSVSLDVFPYPTLIRPYLNPILTPCRSRCLLAISTKRGSKQCVTFCLPVLHALQ